MFQQPWGAGKGGGWQSQKKRDEGGGELGEFLGTIKSFNDKTWYGFIECDDVKALGHQDIFLHGDDKKGYQVGHKVRFTCYLTSRGKPQAKDLKSGLKRGGDEAGFGGGAPAKRRDGR